MKSLYDVYVMHSPLPMCMGKGHAHAHVIIMVQNYEAMALPQLHAIRAPYTLPSDFI